MRSRCTYVAVWPAWIGFGGVSAPFWVAAVSFAEISVYVRGGLAGLDQFGRTLAAVSRSRTPGSSSDPDSEDSGSAAFAQRVHQAEQFRAERGEAEDVDKARSGVCTPRAAMWLKNAEPPLNPPPEINVEGFNIFFRLSARSSNTHQRGLII